MNAIPVVVAGLALYFLGYKFYAKYLSEKIFKLDSNAPVPSRTMEDGKDYIPTNRYVLFGHHFASIAGAAPIVGPAIAVIWGWLPALLWVVLGAVFMGCVHDFSALILSVRHKARSIGDLAGDIIGKKATTAYMIIMFFVVVLLMAIFLRLIMGQFIKYPAVVFPALALVAIAIGIGVLIYRTKIGLGIASVVGIILMIVSIWVGTRHPMALPAAMVFKSPELTWVLLLVAYSFVASVLPIWLLLQPRDYLESFKLYAGLILLFVGIFFTAPKIVAPVIRLDVPGRQFSVAAELRDDLDNAVVSEALRTNFSDNGISLSKEAKISVEDKGGKWQIADGGETYAVIEQGGELNAYAGKAPPIWPFLFISIACGALTGFHSIVASGTTSKQLANEKDAAFVGYGAMAAESSLALCAVIACTAGFQAANGMTGAERWMSHYGSWTGAAGLGAKLGAFVEGGAYFLTSLRIPEDLGRTFVALIIVGFALTTLDSACRLGRYIVAEFGNQHGIPALKNSYIGSAIPAGLAGLLALWTYGGKPAGVQLWPLFGTTNQLLAALVFATVTVYLVKKKTQHWFISIPLVFVVITTVCAMLWKIREFAQDGNWLLVSIGSIILLAGLFLIFLSCGSYVRARSDTKEQA